MNEPPGLKTTIGMALIESARRHRTATAVVFPDQRWTYQALLERVQQHARLIHAMGLKSGDVLGLAMDDGPEFLTLFLGAAMCGVSTAMLTPGVRASVLARRLQYLSIKRFITSGTEGEAFARLMEAHAMTGMTPGASVQLGDETFRKLLADAATGEPWDARAAAARVDPDQDAAILFTSGMTGLPKTCPVSHWNLLCKVQGLAGSFELGSSSRLWIGAQMFQVGFVAPFLTALSIGAATIVTPDREPDRVRSMLIAERLTHAYPIYLQNWLPIVNAPAFLASDFPDLSHICLVGPISALRRAQRAAPQAVVMNTYGSAELGGAICMPRTGDAIELRLGSSGKPFAGHELRIVDPATGSPIRRGGTGEIQVRGAGVPSVHAGNDFGSAYTDDGWLRTADLGSLRNDGSLVYAGRLSEMLKIAGESVSALTIETVLALHGDVAVAQVLARPDPKWGEVAAAFVELRPGATVTPEALIEFCRRHLEAAQVPRYIRFVTNWPTSSSKIYKPLLAGMPVGPKLTD